MMINRSASELSFYITKISIKWLNLLIHLINSQYLNSILSDRNHSITICIEEKYLIDNLLIGSPIQTFPWFNIPNNHSIFLNSNYSKYLSSRHPWVAKNWESWEIAKLVTDVLWSFNRCFIYLVFEIHIIEHLLRNPGKLVCALIM